MTFRFIGDGFATDREEDDLALPRRPVDGDLPRPADLALGRPGDFDFPLPALFRLGNGVLDLPLFRAGEPRRRAGEPRRPADDDRNLTCLLPPRPRPPESRGLDLLRRRLPPVCLPRPRPAIDYK